MPIAENIRKFRKERNMTQKQLGEKCGMYESQIRKYELGTTNPKLGTIIKIADALGVDAAEILAETKGPITIGERIKKLRTERRISTYALAQKTGLSQSSISKIENGNRRLRADEMQLIADALGVDVTEILAGHESVVPVQREGRTTQSIHDRIKEMRLASGLTLSQVATELGVEEATAQRYESGNIKNIKAETLEKLAQLFHCNSGRCNKGDPHSGGRRV